jgi:hypothetical protein
LDKRNRESRTPPNCRILFSNFVMPEDVFSTKAILDPNGIEIKEENDNRSAREACISREEAPASCSESLQKSSGGAVRLLRFLLLP